MTSIAFLFVYFISIYIVLEMICETNSSKVNFRTWINCCPLLLPSHGSVLFFLDIKFLHLYIISKSVCYIYNCFEFSSAHVKSSDSFPSLEWSEGAVDITGWQQIHHSAETGKRVWTARGGANRGSYSCLFPEEQMHRVDWICYKMSNILWKINGLLWHFCLWHVLFLRAGFE